MAGYRTYGKEVDIQSAYQSQRSKQSFQSSAGQEASAYLSIAQMPNLDHHV
jgi:hypothetical protein